MVKKLPLQNGVFALIDDEDFERCSEYNWWLTRHGVSKGEVATDKKDGQGRMTLKHFLFGRKPSKGKAIFQVNQDWLDFTKANLQEVDQSYTKIVRPAQAKGVSKYKGVTYDKARSKWSAVLQWKGIRYRLGRFDTEDEAAESYNEAVKKYVGDFGYLNVIGEDNRREHTEYIFPDNNRKRSELNKTSLFLGVYKRTGTNKYVAQITENKKQMYLGDFEDEIEAAKTYDQKAKELFGEEAILNFAKEKMVGV